MDCDGEEHFVMDPWVGEDVTWTKVQVRVVNVMGGDEEPSEGKNLLDHQVDPMMLVLYLVFSTLLSCSGTKPVRQNAN